MGKSRTDLQTVHNTPQHQPRISMNPSHVLLLFSLGLASCLADGPGGHHHHHGAHHDAHHSPHHVGAHHAPSAHHTSAGHPHTPTVHLPAQFGHHAQQPAANAHQATDDSTVASLIGSTPEFSTLFTALGLTSLAATAASPDATFTVFAPTNSAFEKIPKETLDGLLADPVALEKVLARHIIVGSKLQGKNIPPGSTTLATAGGEKVTAARTNKFIQLTSDAGKAFVTRFDMLAGNGVVHAIDTPI